MGKAKDPDLWFVPAIRLLIGDNCQASSSTREPVDRGLEIESSRAGAAAAAAGHTQKVGRLEVDADVAG